MGGGGYRERGLARTALAADEHAAAPGAYAGGMERDQAQAAGGQEVGGELQQFVAQVVSEAQQRPRYHASALRPPGMTLTKALPE